VKKQYTRNLLYLLFALSQYRTCLPVINLCAGKAGGIASGKLVPPAGNGYNIPIAYRREKQHGTGTGIPGD
jgi:hypothetical protein